MATHAQNIQNLENAVYGEQVRQSMIELFEEDYILVNKGIGIGTDVTSGASSTVGYSDGNVYINSATLDVWKLTGTVWQKFGNLKGIADVTTVPSTQDGGTNVVTVTLTDGTTKTFNVLNGTKGTAGVGVTDAVDNGDGTFNLLLSDGTTTPSTITTIQGIQGPQGIQGIQGATGRGVTGIVSTDVGKNHTLSATYTDGTSNIITTLKDGADGSGTGDMSKATYDVNDNGIVDLAEGLSDGSSTLTFSAVNNKADRSTTLAGYGITDAVKEPASEGSNGQALVTDGNGNRYWATVGTDYITSTTTDFSVTGKKLALSSNVTAKLSELDNTTTDKDKVLTANGDGTTSWKVAKGGHDMLTSVSDVEDNTEASKYVVDALVVKEYSNMYTNRVILNGGNPIAEGETFFGTWDSTTESDWAYSDEFKIGANEDIDLSFLFEVVDDTSTPVYLGGYKWDTTTGKVCIKFGSPLASATRIAVNVTHMRKG